jgi:hypothetical protein
MKTDSATVHVVAWGPYRPVAGALLDDPNRVDAARRGDAVLLPLDRDLALSPLGWSKREYGSAGFDPPYPNPGRFCPVVVRADPSRSFVHWAVELRREISEDSSLSGVLRLGADTTLPGTIAPETGAQGSPIQVAALEWAERAEETGLFAVATGALRASVSIEGLLGLSLYGAATGVRVRRIAVSVCSREEP